MALPLRRKFAESSDKREKLFALGRRSFDRDGGAFAIAESILREQVLMGGEGGVDFFAGGTISVERGTSANSQNVIGRKMRG